VAVATVALTQTSAMVAPGPASPTLQIAIKSTQLGVLYLTASVPLPAVLAEDGRVESAAFVAAWKAVPEASEGHQVLQRTIADVEAAKRHLQAASLLVMAHKSVGGENVLYVTGRAALPDQPVQLLLELRFVPGQPGVRSFFRSDRADLAPLAFAAVDAALSQA
jgi:hypothetical protein